MEEIMKGENTNTNKKQNKRNPEAVDEHQIFMLISGLNRYSAPEERDEGNDGVGLLVCVQTERERKRYRGRFRGCVLGAHAPPSVNCKQTK